MKVTKEFHDICGRKYIGIDNVTYKVPWRYNRVLGVKITGIRTVQSLVIGEDVDITWAVVVYEGIQYKILTSIIIR